jgi:hypothetical protein
MYDRKGISIQPATINLSKILKTYSLLNNNLLTRSLAKNIGNNNKEIKYIYIYKNFFTDLFIGRSPSDHCIHILLIEDLTGKVAKFPAPIVILFIIVHNAAKSGLP